MKTFLPSSFLLLLLVLFAFAGNSQIYSYTNDLSGLPAFVATNATGTNLTRVNGATNPGLVCVDGFNSRGFPATTTFSNSVAAIQFTVTPNLGYQLNITSFTAQTRRNAAGPSLYRLAYSTDGGVTWTNNGFNYTPGTSSCGTMNTLTWDMPDFTHSANVRFRIYGFGAVSVLGDNQLKNITVNGTVTVLDVYGCTNPSACNYNPAATVDDGSCVFPGCTNALACNYDAAAGCDDGSCVLVGDSCDDGDVNTIGDFIQGDCTCLGYPVNDEKADAVEIVQDPISVCNGVAVNLVYATVSGDALSPAITGEDLWYKFTAVTTAARIEAYAAGFDVMIELQDAFGNMLDYENVTGAGGYEYLNRQSLVVGNTYYVIIRNYDSSLGTGWADLCIKYFPQTVVDNWVPLYTNTCGTIKAVFTGAYSYEWFFTNQTTLVTTSYTKVGNTVIILRDVPGMQWNTSYDVSINPTYHVFDAIGNLEVIYVVSTAVDVVNTGPQPLMAIRPVDQCADGPNPLGSTVAGEPFVCLSVDYEWEFVRTDMIELPIYHFRGAANRFLVLSTVPGLVAGGTYDVRVRPIFSYGSGNWGPVKCMSIIGPASLIVDNSQIEPEFPFEEEYSASEVRPAFKVYPNPSDGSQINITLNADDLDGIPMLRCFDAMGNTVINTSLSNLQNGISIIELQGLLSKGVYILMVSDESKLLGTTRLVVN